MRWLYFPPFLMLLLFAPAAIAWVVMDRDRRPPFLIYGMRWFLGILFAVSGLAKLIPHFPNTMGPVDLEITLGHYGLAAFGRFIALTEVGTGILLLTRRYATLGAMLLTPILVSILVITTALGWRGTPYVVAVFLGMALVLVAYDYRPLLPLLGEPTGRAEPGEARLLPHLLWLGALGTTLGVLGAIRVASVASPVAWGGVTVLAGLVTVEWRRRAA